MSKIGKKPIEIPSGVSVEIKDNKFSAKGPKGTLSFDFSLESEVKLDGNIITVTNIGKTKKAPAIWGTTAKLVANIIEGVTKGFQKQLELNGVGYRMNVAGKKINFALGFSHPVEVAIPDGIEAKIEANVLTISGIDKQRVGQFSAEIKKLKPVEPYKGKGFRYVGEIVRKKVGKKATAAG